MYGLSIFIIIQNNSISETKKFKLTKIHANNTLRICIKMYYLITMIKTGNDELVVFQQEMCFYVYKTV